MLRSQMSPVSALNDTTYLRVANAEQVRDVVAGVPTRVQGADVADALGVQLGFDISLASRRVQDKLRAMARRASALAHLVPHVVFCRADEQVRGIAARRVIAVMAHVQSRIEGAIRQPVGHAVRSGCMHLSTGVSVIGLPVALRVSSGGSPEPAVLVTTTGHMCPEIWRKNIRIHTPILPRIEAR